MKLRTLIILKLFFVVINCSSQSLNAELKNELKQILFTDQIFREYIDNNTSAARKNEIAVLTDNDSSELHRNIFKILWRTDSINLLKIEKIIREYGYPGKSLVGEPENTAAFFVIQHNMDKIPRYYPLVEEAAKKGEIPFRLSAMMLDRLLANEGKEQIYGTQVYGKRITNKTTGKQEFFMYVVPIKDPENVNQRRKEAGFDSTVEENAKRLGVEYKAYTYDDINKIIN